MSSLNQCSFIGNMGADPESRAMASGDSVTNFRIAVTERWKDKQSGEQKEKTEWISCVAWRGLAEVVAKYGHKGMKCFVQGKMTTRMWEKDGIKRYTTEIQVDQFIMLGSKADSEASRGNTGNQNTGNQNTGGGQQGGGKKDEGGFDDDIPF